MSRANQELQFSTPRVILAIVISVATLLLIFAGGVVTSKNVGLSVPDWPTSYGYHMWAMPFSMWTGGVFYEHVHRVMASVAGCLVMLMAIWLMWREKRTWVRRTGLACFGAVVLQGILGGLTVLMSLPVWVSVFHGVLAQVFLCLTIVLAYALSREWFTRSREETPSGDRRFAWKAGAVAALVLVQLVVAAFMRHDIKQQGGVAIPDFPRMAGQWIPRFNAQAVAWVNDWRDNAVWEHEANFELNDPIKAYQMVVHFAHRLLALLIVASLVWLNREAFKRFASGHPVRRTVVALDVLVLLEVTLGMFTVWSNKGELITSFHVAVGAALLAGTVLLGLRAGPVRGSGPVAG